jgi:hypothetical protein
VWLRVRQHVTIETILGLERMRLYCTLRVRAEEYLRFGEGGSIVGAVVRENRGSLNGWSAGVFVVVAMANKERQGLLQGLEWSLI